jgi:beta-xylosidase
MVATEGLFAPTIRHHDGVFYIVCTNCYYARNNWQTDNFLIHTRDIWADVWSDPIPFAFCGIHPSLYFDDDGRTYIQGSWTQDRLRQPDCTIKQFEIDIQSGAPLSETREIWDGFSKRGTEGPHIYKKDSWYYLLVAEGGTFEHHMLSMARSKDIWGPYESCPQNPIMTADGTDEYVQNVGHGEIFQDANGDWWAAASGLQGDQDEAPMGRETFLTPVEWPKDGWPIIEQPQMSFNTPRTVQLGFASAHLIKNTRLLKPHIDDLYLHKPLRRPYKKASSITLTPTTSTLSATSAPLALLARRQRSMTTIAATTVLLDNEATHSNAIGGLTVYKDPLRHASISVCLSTRLIHVHFVDASKDYEYTASYPEPVARTSTTVDLRIIASAECYALEFRDSENGRRWLPVDVVDTGMLSARDFTGTVMGIFALTDANASPTASASDDGCDSGSDVADQKVTFRDFEVRS